MMQTSAADPDLELRGGLCVCVCGGGGGEGGILFLPRVEPFTFSFSCREFMFFEEQKA